MGIRTPDLLHAMRRPQRPIVDHSNHMIALVWPGRSTPPGTQYGRSCGLVAPLGPGWYLSAQGKPLKSQQRTATS
jgi:hypothetical protein